MSEATKAAEASREVWFAVVDEVQAHPETGEIMLKRPLFRSEIFCSQTQGWTNQTTGERHIERTIVAIPDFYSGLYGPFSPTNDDDKLKIRSLKRRAEQDISPIIGPFNSRIEAQTAQIKARKKLPQERVAELENEVATLKTGALPMPEAEKLKATAMEQSQEIAELRARIAEMEKKGKRGE